MMTKGKFGLSPAAIAVIAFVFAALGQPVAVLLVAGFALLAERDEWLNRQVLQALLLSVAYSLTTLVTGWVFGGLARFFGWLEVYKAHTAMNKVDSVADGVIYAAFIAVCVVSVLRTMRGRDAALPVLSKMAGGDIAAAFARQAETQTPPAQPRPQPAAPAYEPPAQAHASTQPPTQVAAGFCPSCGAPLTDGSAFCSECGTKIG